MQTWIPDGFYTRSNVNIHMNLCMCPSCIDCCCCCFCVCALHFGSQVWMKIEIQTTPHSFIINSPTMVALADRLFFSLSHACYVQRDLAVTISLPCSLRSKLKIHGFSKAKVSIVWMDGCLCIHFWWWMRNYSKRMSFTLFQFVTRIQPATTTATPKSDNNKNQKWF